jgi:signal transduction histidine kinase
MPPAEGLRRSLARTDVRAALTIASLVLAALIVQGFALYTYAANENLDEAERWMVHALRSVALRADRGDSLELAVSDLAEAWPGRSISVRIRDARGELVASRGPWPAPDARVEMGRSNARAAFRGWHVREHLVGSTPLRDGRSVDLALPLSHFHAEAAEMARHVAVTGTLSVLVALLTAWIATLRAFSPLRRATHALRDLDAGELDRRLPTRGTGDPVDQHAETLNRVLARIDAGFARLRDFSSDVAHELRTPLNRIANVADVAIHGDEPREQRVALETVQETTDELARMVQSLLLLAELGDRRAALHGPPLDVDAWIAHTADLYAPSFEEQGVKLAYRTDAGTIEGDRMLLDRILVNLLDNALAQVAPGGCVEIEARRTPQGVTLCVDDSGPGVPVWERERIFERFAHGSTNARRSGHGLGLAIARAVARLHGGDIAVETSGLGGARFRVELPVRAGAPFSASQPAR